MAEGPEIHEIPPILERFLDRGLRLPPCPAVIARLAELIRDSETQSSELAKLLKMDTALTAALLKVANSALYGASRQIATVENAILRLGYAEVMKIAIGLKSKEFLNVPQMSIFSGWLYEHSLRTGLILRRVCRDINPKFEEHYFTAGILHDIGRMVLAQVDPAYVKFCLHLPTLLREEQIIVMGDEKKRWGNDHAEIGAALCEFWNLPLILQTMVGEHHRGSQTDRPAMLFQAADLWATLMTVPTQVPPKVYHALLEARICMKVHLNPDQAVALGEQIDKEVHAMMGA